VNSSKKTKTSKYTVVLLADSSGGYTAVVPALPGCVTEGETVEEALEMAKDAIELSLESAREHDEEVVIEGDGTVIATVEATLPSESERRVKATSGS